MTYRGKVLIHPLEKIQNHGVLLVPLITNVIITAYESIQPQEATQF